MEKSFASTSAKSPQKAPVVLKKVEAPARSPRRLSKTVILPAKIRKTKKTSARLTPKKQKPSAKSAPSTPKSPVKDFADNTNASFGLDDSMHPPVASSQVSQDSMASFSLDGPDTDKSAGTQILSVQQQRENRMKFQRMRALKSMSKYNTKLNQQRISERKYYYDLQTNMMHVPRRGIQVITPDPELMQHKKQPGPPVALRTGAYPVSLIGTSQYCDKVRIFSAAELGYLPLNSVIHRVIPYAVQCLNMTVEEYRLHRQSRIQNGEFDLIDSDDESILMSDEERIERPPRANSVISTQTTETPSSFVEERRHSRSVTGDVSVISDSHDGSVRPNPPKKGRPPKAKSTESLQIPDLDKTVEDIPETSDKPNILLEVMDLSKAPTDTCYYCFVREHQAKIKQEPAVEELKPLELPPQESSTKKKPRRPPPEMDLSCIASETLLVCQKCEKKYHPSCAGLSNPTLFCMKKYPWDCSECKVCNKCSNATQEDRMLFCDLCDRGYHSFCVGVQKIPSGRWLCESCAHCSFCGAVRPNEEGMRGRACVWQLQCDEDPPGNITQVKVMCYPCYKKMFKKGRDATKTTVAEEKEETTGSSLDLMATE